ncbi:ATP-binding cassette domain-containing protein, partial [uncultured Corynebacterium sp.]|uniref:ABC transporter ATP-binding protein n=1 Tax=uncultured Corynebacterium sp. TaxID=159447 RepID=UPI0025D716F8
RTVVLACHGAGPAAAAFALSLGLPLLAEPSSNARFSANAIAAYPLLLGAAGGRDADAHPLAARIERVVLFGRPTLTRTVNALLARPEALVLDCPLDGLDAAAVDILRRTIADFPGPVTVYDRAGSPLSDDAPSHQRLLADGTLTDSPAPKPAAESVTPDDAEQRITRAALLARDVVFRRGGVGPINLEVPAGRVVHLAGPNGCGKTTLFLGALGLLKYRGTLRAEGLKGWAPTQMDQAVTCRTVAEELAVGASEELAEAAIDFARLGKWAGTHPLDVPAAKRRIVLVAAAMVRGADLVMLDEPTVGLDAPGYSELAELMHRYANGEYAQQIGRGSSGAPGSPGGQSAPTVLWTCHDARFAAQVSDLRIDMAG